MSQEGKVDGINPDNWGAIPVWMVARLSGLSKRRLAAWARTGLITVETAWNNPDEHFYSWYQYERARIAARLIEHGLPARKVRICLNVLDERYREWLIECLSWLPVRVREVEVEDRAYRFHTVSEPPPDAMMFLSLDTPARHRVLDKWRSCLPKCLDVDYLINELIEQTPLGKLSRFNGLLAMDRTRRSALPCVPGTRLSTEDLTGWSAAEILSGWDYLTADQAEAIVEFNIAVRNSDMDYASVA